MGTEAVTLVRPAIQPIENKRYFSYFPATLTNVLLPLPVSLLLPNLFELPSVFRSRKPTPDNDGNDQIVKAGIDPWIIVGVAVFIGVCLLARRFTKPRSLPSTPVITRPVTAHPPPVAAPPPVVDPSPPIQVFSREQCAAMSGPWEIWVLDDMESCRYMLSMDVLGQLAKRGIEPAAFVLKSFDSAIEPQRLLSTGPVKLAGIVCDNNMGQRSVKGVVLLNEVHRSYPDLPLVMETTDSFERIKPLVPFADVVSDLGTFSRTDSFFDAVARRILG